MKATLTLTGVLSACKPPQEVLEGELDDVIFAADFGQLIDGSTPKVYGHAETFFRNTDPTPDDVTPGDTFGKPTTKGPKK